MPSSANQIAIDGPAASGKSTVARTVAERLGACYINTGEMYRTLAWVVVQRQLDPERDAAAIVALLPTLEIRYQPGHDGRLALMLNGQPVAAAEIRAPQVTRAVSAVAAIPAVRHWLVARQQESARHGLIVMEGRDIGTVVLPSARHKFFITASPLERARRRLAQSGETFTGATLESVAAEITERDRLDSTRAVSPLRPAADAVLIDTTTMTIDQVVDQVIRHIRGAAPAA
jgi:cytidylate kinase